MKKKKYMTIFLILLLLSLIVVYIVQSNKFFKETNNNNSLEITSNDLYTIDTNDYTINKIKPVSYENITLIFFLGHKKNMIQPSIGYIYRHNNDYINWTNPVAIINNVSYIDSFDCVFDKNNEIFHFFLSNGTDNGYSIYYTKGMMQTYNYSINIDMEPILLIGPSDRLHTGPVDPSALITNNGELHLFYCWITGGSENWNEIHHDIIYNQCSVFHEVIGISNSPMAIEDKNKNIVVYSNLWTYTDEKQYCISEWEKKDGLWVERKLRYSPTEGSVNPYVVNNNEITLLIYDHKPYHVGSKTNIYYQIKMNGNKWQKYEVIIHGESERGIKFPSAILSEDMVTIYYIDKKEIQFVNGSIT